MNNIILGSGIVGLLAKAILGPSWKIIPFYRSRFFTFNPALDDNFLIRHQELDDFIKDLTGSLSTQTAFYKRTWSVAGQLIPTFDSGLCGDWHAKIFGNQVPPQSEPYFAGKMGHFVYDLRVNQLYAALMNKDVEDLKVEASKGQVTELGDHYYVRNGVREEFDNAVSTIPLYALYNLLGIKNQPLPSKTLHYLHVETPDLDFEGNNQALVVDRLFSFFKVTNVAPGRYLFYLHEEIPNPGIYLMTFMKKFDILEGTSIEHALPLGPIPKLEWLESKDVYCVGSYAQWDWCMDVGSCVLRLLRYAQRGFKPFKKELVQ
jgi:hypothetical protein